MKKLHVLLIALAAILSTPAVAETWTVLGLLTTKATGQTAKVEFVEIDGFDSKQACQHVVSSEAFSKEGIGRNSGTDGKLPAVSWNFDGDCWLKRSD